MLLPKFLIADNSDFPENVYVVHTSAPRFIVDIDTEDVEILDGSDINNPAISELVVQAFAFYEAELDKYDEEDDEE
ncbi:MAG: hypothetical protein RL662_205 [Bacteroidota bacterium]|jgi:hypothetical protein